MWRVEFREERIFSGRVLITRAADPFGVLMSDFKPYGPRHATREGFAAFVFVCESSVAHPWGDSCLFLHWHQN